MDYLSLNKKATHQWTLCDVLEDLIFMESCDNLKSDTLEATCASIMTAVRCRSLLL
jgi:hypothetical protein